MGHFWTSFFEHVRHCGRNATLFLIALAAFVAFIAAVAVVWAVTDALHVDPLAVLAVTAFSVLVGLAIGLRRARTRRRLQKRFEPRGPLSDIEIRRAREKLTKRA